MQFQSSDFELFYLVVGLIGLVLAITWAVFPFLVLARLNRLIATQDAIHRELLYIQQNGMPVVAPRAEQPLQR